MSIFVCLYVPLVVFLRTQDFGVEVLSKDATHARLMGRSVFVNGLFEEACFFQCGTAAAQQLVSSSVL